MPVPSISKKPKDGDSGVRFRFPRVESEESIPEFQETYLVLEFKPDIDAKALLFLIEKIKSTRLLVASEPSNSKLILHVSATQQRLYELADELAFMKRTRKGKMMIFSFACLDDFWEDGMEDILTLAEKQFLVKYALESVKAQSDDEYVPGYPKVSLCQTKPLIQIYYYHGLVKDFYALHETQYVKRLAVEWYKFYRRQPLDKIRHYFGESIGLYFGFLGFYSRSLIFPAILGVVQYFVPYELLPFCCVFYLIWITTFLELWKRKSSVFAYRWGTISLTTLDVPRADFYGKIGPDPITGRMTPQYPYWKTLRQIYFVSVPIILMCLILAGYITVAQFWVEDYLVSVYGIESYIPLIPSIVISIWIALLPTQYSKFATWLTNLENHRTQAQFDRHRVNKLIVIEFVNNFLSLFYVAFVRQDLKLLKTYLLTQLMIVQFIQNVQELLWPICYRKFQQWFSDEDKKQKKDPLLETNRLNDLVNIQELDADDPRIKQRIKEGQMDAYVSTYEDYLELYIQFGYVVLFAAVCPLAALLALVNNILEIRIDAFRLCKAYRRPFARRVKNIGAWQLAFESLAVISIMTNCAVLYMAPQTIEWRKSVGAENGLLVFVAVEHLLLGIVWMIHKLTPDKPPEVRMALARANYESQQALKREAHKNRHLRRILSNPCRMRFDIW